MKKLIFALFLLIPAQSLAHGDAKWIMEGRYAYCCGPEDCRTLDKSEIEIRPTGWFVKPLNRVVPFSEVKPSIDHHFWLCVREGEDGEKDTECFFAPGMGM